MQNTHNIDALGAALIDLLGFLNSPKRDEALLHEAGVRLDRALFLLLVGLGKRGELGVAELADLVGRDYTTVSRQLSKLASLRLVARRENKQDRRQHTAGLTREGRKVVRDITGARRRLLAKALTDWNETDRVMLAHLSRRFVDDLMKMTRDT